VRGLRAGRQKGQQPVNGQLGTSAPGLRELARTLREHNRFTTA
jgi:hypothetical protein